MTNKIFSSHKQGEIPLPEKIIIETTMHCNLHCTFCGRDMFNYKEISYKEMELVVNNFGKSIRKIVLTGGEPFLRNDIFDMLNLFFRKKYSVGILTNGTLLNKVMIEKLFKYDNLNLGFSIDGLKETHNAIRGEDAFQRTFVAIKKISKRIPIGITTVITKDNIEEIPFLFEKIAPYINFYTVQFEMFNNKKEIEASAEFFNSTKKEIATWVNNQTTYNYPKDKVLKLIKTLRKLSKKYDIPFCTEPTLVEEYLDDFFAGEILKKNPFCNHFKVARCDVEGNLIFCHLVKKRFGSLLDVSLPEIWNSEEMKKVRRKFFNEKKPPICRRCCKLVMDPPVFDIFTIQS